MKTVSSNRSKKISGLLAAICGMSLLNASAQVAINETFQGSSLPSGWTVSGAPAGTKYNYTLSNGILFSDADPVAGESTSIVPASANTRGFVTFRYNFPEAIQDFTASMSFTWDNTVGITQSGASSANAATPSIYFGLYDASNGIVTRTGIYDNWASGTGGYAGLLTGSDPVNATNGTAPFVSNGLNTINVTRSNGVISVNWVDGDGNTLLTKTGSNSTELSYMVLQFGMLRSAANPTNTKFGSALVSEVTFNTIPEPGTTSLIGISSIVLGGLIGRKYKDAISK